MLSSVGWVIGLVPIPGCGSSLVRNPSSSRLRLRRNRFLETLLISEFVSPVSRIFNFKHSLPLCSCPPKIGSVHHARLPRSRFHFTRLDPLPPDTLSPIQKTTTTFRVPFHVPFHVTATSRFPIHPSVYLDLETGTMIQAFLTMFAAIAIWQSGQGSIAPNRSSPAWSNTVSFVCLGFMSASMGLQGIMGKRINSQFATTVVLTSVWCELVADPKLFNLRKGVVSRDHKALAIFGLFLGAFTGRAILAVIGSAGALGVATGIRLLLAFGWLFVPSKDGGVVSRPGPV